jgi:hypothetical protein
MRRNVVFERGRGWRPEDDDFQDLNLRPGRGAEVGEYGAAGDERVQRRLLRPRR